MSNEIENAEFEEIKKPTENVQQIAIQNLGFIQNDDDDEDDSGSISSDVKKLTDMAEQYRKSDISQNDVFVDSNTGEILDRSKLPPLEQIRIAAKSMNQSINDPNKNCKKCHGRGYTGINRDGNVPVPCSCIYEDFYKNNPDAKQPSNFPNLNRQARRVYNKQMSKYIAATTKKEIDKMRLIEKSKANLGKNSKKEDVNAES